MKEELRKIKSVREILTVTSEKTEQFFNLSYEIEEIVRKSAISEGFCCVNSLHTTSAVFLENDSEDLYADWLAVLDDITRSATAYRVDYAARGVPHLKQVLFGGGVVVPISDGRLDLGPRQYIMYGDFDGTREKQVVVKIIGE